MYRHHPVLRNSEVVYHLHGKTGWPTVCTNGKQKSPMKNSVTRIKIGVGLGTSENRKWYTHFRFGNSGWKFWTTFQEIPFSCGNFRSGRKK